MNIFLPYENDIRESIESLDDKRLNKQILECYQLLRNAIKEQNGEEIKGYKNHPIYIHYKENINFLIDYGFKCCKEYNYRFNKNHTFYNYFTKSFFDYDGGKGMVLYKPFYMEGSKGKPNYIRTTENVSRLYQKKLINKWENDKRQPKWTNRELPSFYINYIGDTNE